MKPDPFRAALCRETGRDPRDWDPDADVDQQATAAAVCGACPAHDACAALRDALGAKAAGTWAGRFTAWAEHPDPVLAAFDAIFGASFTPTVVVVVDQAQLTLDFWTEA